MDQYEENARSCTKGQVDGRIHDSKQALARAAGARFFCNHR